MSDEDQVVKKAAPKKPSLNPNTVDMVLEAITALDDRKVNATLTLALRKNF